MHIHIHNYHHSDLENITMKLSDVLSQNESFKNQLNKVELEVLTRQAELQEAIDQLTAALADAPLTDEQAASFAAVQTAIQALDDINPDAPVV